MLFWIAMYLLLGGIVFHYSRAQPYPEISGRFSALLICTGALLWLSTTAPRETAEAVAPTSAALIGGVGVIYGVIKMALTKDDVVVAPFAGMLLCFGAISLLAERWEVASQTEQIGSFIFASILIMLEIYLAFRGLVVGVQGISWSKSGLRQARRGLIHGDNGAIAHFERSWDMEEQWINAMSHAALALIHANEGDSAAEKEHILELEKLGGWESVDEGWIEAIKTSLKDNQS